MPDLADGESTEMKGSAREPYVLKNVGGVYSCTCPAWRNQSVGIEQRTCKHLQKLRGAAAEEERVGSTASRKPVRKASAAGEDGEEGASTAPPLLLAQSWNNDLDLAGWWMSEKLDGVRAYWDGTQFISRQGNVFHVPAWFAEQLPATPLDGELWLARKSFQRTVSIVRRRDKSEHWKQISYLVFDAPAAEGTFEERVAYLQETLAEIAGKNVLIHAHERVRSVEHLREELARVEGLGGEGLMLREPGSKYEAGRSSTLLKVKTFHDAEAHVLEHLPGAGRHAGRLGALAVQLPDGTRFSVGTGFSDAERNSPPAVGSTITFRYQELSDGGVPRFPSFIRVTTGAASTSLPAEPPGVSKRAFASAPAATAKPAKMKAAPEKSEACEGPARRFEFSEGSSNKFWEITVADTEVTVRYGRIGTNGQTQTKSFADEAAAQRHADKLIEEKVEKGYVEQQPAA